MGRAPRPPPLHFSQAPAKIRLRLFGFQLWCHEYFEKEEENTHHSRRNLTLRTAEEICEAHRLAYVVEHSWYTHHK